MSQSIKLTENRFVYNGMPYLRRGADAVMLGGWGPKRHPLGKAPYVEVKGTLPAERLKLRRTTEVQIDFSQISATDIGVDIKVLGMDLLKPAALLERGRKGELSLYALEAENVLEVVNDSPQLLQELRKLKEPRIVTKTWVVVAAHIARTLGNSLSLGLKGMAHGVALTGNVKNESSSEIEVVVSPESVFAFQYCEPKFGGKHDDKVQKLDDDLPGSPS